MKNQKSRKNIKFLDFVYAKFNELYCNSFEKPKTLLLYRKIFKNYMKIIKNKKNNNYPIKAELKNGKKIIFKNQSQIYAIIWAGDNDCYFDDKLIIIKLKGLSEIKLANWENDVDLDVLFDNEYGKLPVKGKSVIDIGANIGDSSIYFALKGAKKIIAIEPSLKNFNFALENLKLNGVNKQIELLHGACGEKLGYSYIDSVQGGSTFTIKNENKHGMKIPMITLEDILAKIKTQTAILKIDCEGCEYEIILSASKETLRTFTHIQIEYHYGYLNLQEKLEESGFKVSASRPHISKKLKNNLESYVGFLYATKCE